MPKFGEVGFPMQGMFAEENMWFRRKKEISWGAPPCLSLPLQAAYLYKNGSTYVSVHSYGGTQIQTVYLKDRGSRTAAC
ncbi:hypothetical protein SUGI_0074520 [Cryptomeria japonica]|nr:hypothetical protein SUGI_0074520 [Cryptomeria japonica]